jgi:glycosyltransferase involved in cell wall biosynthesis
MADLPIVVIFSAAPVTLQSPGPAGEFETQELDCRWYASDENLPAILAQDRPSVIVSIGKLADFAHLQKAPYEVKRRWLHFSEGTSPQAIGKAAFNCFIRNLFQRSEGAPPLVSVFTPTYRTGELIHRPYQSLLRQTYNNWEWVVVDDSDDDGATLELLQALAHQDERIALYKSPRRSGIIGEIKRRACMQARGEILVELDHDDELTYDALDKVVKTFAKYPQAGFAYSDWTEVFEESGECVNYGAHWAYGYGSYRSEEYDGKTLLVANTPPINPKTIRHIVGVPNHLRAWRRSTYLEIGGHNPAIHVADDYELLIRTFLHTKMAHIPYLGYIQYMRGGSNTQDVRRKEIQRLVRYFRDYYDEPIHERFQRLRVDDYVWDKASGRSVPQLEWVPSPAHEPQCNITVEL